MPAPLALLHLPGLTRDADPNRETVTAIAHTRRETLLQLLRSRTQADPRWTLEELATELQCTPRTVQRYFEWLRKHGRLALEP